MDTTEFASAFYERFLGLDRAHGRYIVAPAEKGKKIKGQATTEKTGPTVETWIAHLEGKVGLGIVPIRDGDVCIWGAIDIDVYDLDLKKLAAEVHKLHLPLVPCRTKSGGCHLYIFLRNDAPADVVRTKLIEWATLLGYTGCEVFPKQTALGKGKNSTGNWINMPYFKGIDTDRYAVSSDGDKLDMEGFFKLAASREISSDELKEFTVDQDDIGDLLLEAPPCLQSLARKGFPEGTRNNGLLAAAVYLKLRFPDIWEEKIDEFNHKYMAPPLGAREVAATVKSASKKTYTYRCGEEPIVSCCNRQLCVTRKFGVGQNQSPEDAGVKFGDLVKISTKPPLWLWSVNGQELELTTGELMDQSKCHLRIVEECNIWPMRLKPFAWRKLVQDKLDNAEMVSVPEDATQYGQLIFQLTEFCTRRAKGEAIEDLLRGVPYTDTKEGRVYFRAADFIEYLKRHSVGLRLSEREVYSWLRRKSVQHHFKILSGRGTNFWSVAWESTDVQTEPSKVPSKEESM